MHIHRQSEFESLLADFAAEYLDADIGRDHMGRYVAQRDDARQRFDAVREAANRGDDFTDLVLDGLLPHRDTTNNRSAGKWIHIAPAVTRDVREWFEGAKWATGDEWPARARAIWDFVTACVDAPDALADHVAAFEASGVSRGMQAGMLSPVLNALRPDAFLVANAKSRRVADYLTREKSSTSLAKYPATNAKLKTIVEALEPELRRVGGDAHRPSDVFDCFCHWLVAVRSHTFDDAAYYKIAPGEQAWHWDECRDGGFIAIGWDELGDLTGFDEAAFARRAAECQEAYGWNEVGMRQVFRFSRIRPGDRVIANRGISRIIGVGTVTSEYYFVPGVRHPHRLDVRWDDTTEREVLENGWRRTFVDIGPAKFASLVDAPPVGTAHVDPDASGPFGPQEAFTTESFELLAALDAAPRIETYKAHRDRLMACVRDPLRDLMQAVAERMPDELVAVLETESRTLSRFPKNDYGRGGVWPFLWGAFYPRGGRRLDGPQLYVTAHPDVLQIGFSVGDYGTDPAERLATVVAKDPRRALQLLKTTAGESGWTFGLDDVTTTWDAWVASGIRNNGKVFVDIPADECAALSMADLTDRVTDVFMQLAPLVFMATEGDAYGRIAAVLDASVVEDEHHDDAWPVYSTDDWQRETHLPADLLRRWCVALERKRQAVFYGPPGTGKTWVAQRVAKHIVGGGNGVVRLVQFHPAYTYEDFMEGIRPHTTADERIVYRTEPGRFVRFCDEARRRSGPSVLIIDELNRAEIARVFGELMYLLEYRDREIELASGTRFRIPEQVRIIATMNTADRSLAVVDHALRRRFAFLRLWPPMDVLVAFHDQRGTDARRLVGVLEELNAAIGDPNLHVGISFFLNDWDAQRLGDIWQVEIEPYLEEVFFDQPQALEHFRWTAVGRRL